MSFLRRPLTTTALTAFAVSAVMGFSTATVWADNGGDNHGTDVSAVARTNDQSGDNNHGAVVSAVARNKAHHDGLLARLANAITFAGLTPVKSDTTTYLRIANSSADAGTATVTLRAADTGATLGAWTSASVPS